MTDRFAARQAGLQLDRDHAAGDPFAAAIRGTRMPIVITDPRQQDNPIVFANDAFLQLTGYGRDEVIGENCRFLQGPGTDPAMVREIGVALAARTPTFHGEILNYRKDGTQFWNALFISPVVDDKGNLVFHFASQLDVTERRNREREVAERAEALEVEVRRRTAELQRTIDHLKTAAEARTVLLHEVDHRVKNNLQMIMALMQMQLRTLGDGEGRRALGAMHHRLEAIATVHRRLYQADDVSRFDVATFARDLAADLVSASGRADIHLEFDVETVQIGADKAAPLALMVSELLSNAVTHAFPDRRGRILIRVKRSNGHFEIAVHDDGLGVVERGLEERSFGRTIITTLARQLQARVGWSQDAGRTVASIDLPIAFVEQDTLQEQK